MTNRRLGYVPALDGLRAVAITLVVLCHAVPGFTSGNVGVEVFFVLSGFLITALIARQIKAGGFSRRRFYARRAIRLVPALVVMVVVMTPFALILMGGEPTWLGAAAALLYFTPFVAATIFTHTWTLAVEEWFYLLWPLVLGKLFRDRLTLQQAAVLTGSAGVLVQAAAVISSDSMIVRPSALLVGSALGLWWLDGGRFARPAEMLVLGVALIVASPAAGPMLWSPLSYWMAVGGTVLAVGAVASDATGPVMRALEVAPLVAVGVVSYEWYLLHAPMLRLSYQVWGYGGFWLIVPASLVLAFALHGALAPAQTQLRGRLDPTPASV